MTYQIAICDDEEKQRAYIKSLVEGWLRQTFHHTKIQEYASSEQFLFEQAYDRTQILFLDIEMEKMDGIALAREIRKHNRQMQIIFVTGYMEYIQEGYDVEALHYLLKPVSQEKIDSVLDRAVERLKTADAVLLVESGGEVLRLPLKEIRFIESNRNYNIIHADNDYEVRGTLSELEAKLDEAFVRVGRSYLVNLNYVRRIGKTELILNTGEKLLVPRGSYKKLNEAFIISPLHLIDSSQSFLQNNEPHL